MYRSLYTLVCEPCCRLDRGCTSHRVDRETATPPSTSIVRDRFTTFAAMKPERVHHRVLKTLAPTDRGAIGLARHYGDALICVRYRTDANGKFRHTTVELLVQTAPIRPRALKIVGIKTEPHERYLHSMIKTAGGTWDAKARLWHLPRRIAGILNLRNRIVEK